MVYALAQTNRGEAERTRVQITQTHDRRLLFPPFFRPPNHTSGTLRKDKGIEDLRRLERVFLVAIVFVKR